MPNLSLLTKRLLPTGLILLSFALFTGCAESEKSNLPEQTETTAKTEFEYTDSLIIELAGRDSLTVLDLLEQIHQVEKVNTALGVFVKGIDSLESSSTLFWVYSVNDSMPEIAADKYQTKDGDQVRWHYRKMGKN